MQPKARPTSSCERRTLGLAAAGDKLAQAAPASARTLKPGTRARARAVQLPWSSGPPCVCVPPRSSRLQVATAVRHLRRATRSERPRGRRLDVVEVPRRPGKGEY